jgi:hypothetical protein
VIPHFYDGKNLPEGLHRATIHEVITHFGNSARRAALCTSLQNIIATAQNCHFRKIILFGSFISSKNDPGDIDLFWTLPPETDTDQIAPACKQLINPQTSQALFSCDVFWCFDEHEAIVRMVGLFGFDREMQKRGLIMVEL